MSNVKVMCQNTLEGFEQPPAAFTFGTCDGCGPSTVARVAASVAGSLLEFCGHCYTTHEAALSDQGASVVASDLIDACTDGKCRCH